MKKIKIKIDIYDWDILFLEIQNKSDSKKLGKELKKFRIQKEDYKYTINNIKEDVLDGGEHFYNLRLRKSLILIYKTSNKEERFNVIFHEKRHCEDRMIQYLKINDIESVAYIAGYIAQKLSPLL